MKTIVHVELSDKERSDLAKLLDDNSCTKRLVTRKEVTELTQSLVRDVLNKGLRKENDQSTKTEPDTEEAGDADSGQRRDGGGHRRLPDHVPAKAFVPSRGDEPYLAQPKNTEIAAACSRILDDAALIESFAWATIERNRK